MTLVVRRPAILLVALMTAACSLTNTGDPNTAAVVGDTRIATSTVDQNFDAVSGGAPFREAALRDPTGQGLNAQSQLVAALIRSEGFRIIAERRGVEVDQAAIDALLDETVERLGQDDFERQLAADGMSEGMYVQRLRDDQLLRALQEDAGDDLVGFVRDEMSDIPIEVNPRFGEWNADMLEVQPVDPFAPAGEEPGGPPAPAGEQASPPPEQ